jgi:iron complex outermembrane receptor protein
MYEGNRNDVYWNLQGTRKQAGNYSNRYDGKVFNSGFNEWNGNGMLGLSKKWGYAQINFSSFNQEVGIIEGERDSLGRFVEHEIINDSTEVENVIPDSELEGFQIHTPKQKINHHKVSLNGKIFKNNSFFQYTFGFQQNHRREFEQHLHNGVVEEEASIDQLLNTINYDLNFHKHLKEWETTFGLNGYWQKGMNLGEEFIIPEYQLNDFGLYGITQRTIEKFHISGGLRYNYRNLKSEELYLNDFGVSDAMDTTAEQKFTSFERNFSSLAYSVGFSYKITKEIITKLNLSGGFRSPNLSELGSNGAHHGTFRYEIGNADLKPETSFQTDFSFNAETQHISLEISAFNNVIQDFIFSRKLSGIDGNDSLIIHEGEVNRVFRFVQQDAQLFGGEFSLDIHPHPFDWLHIENSFSFVEGRLKNGTDSTKYLPFIPAPRLQSELRAHFHERKGRFSNFFFSVNMNYHFQKENIYRAYNTETNTPSYVLFNAGTGFDFHDKKQKTIFTFVISAQNITDKAYQNHLSRLKYLSENELTGRQGVFNMGRNFMFKLIIPMDIK